MKKISISVSLVFCIAFAQAQNKFLTIEDAVIKQRTTLAPERLTQLMWVPGGSTFTYVDSKGNLIKGETNSKDKKTFLELSALNKVLKNTSQDTLKKFPTIT